MNDLIDSPQIGMNDPEYSVSEISGAIKRLIEGEFSHVRIKGEVGRVSFPRSGHVYLDLKDDKSVISAVIWKGVAARLQIRPEEGLEVVATGRITTFGGHSKYQLVIEDIKPAGIGALMAMLEKRKAMLAEEGLFDEALKKAIPYLPEVIGVVTSPTGAVIRDILHRLRYRFPRNVLIWPVAVQGDKCAEEVARAIAGFNSLAPESKVSKPDLLIVARGGGSLEDLWGFNEEIVARATAASDIPLISAVGHETDTTLIDFVSDKRAPTPTAAAELAVPVQHELFAWVKTQDLRMKRASNNHLASRLQRLRDLGRLLPKPEVLFHYERQKLDHMSERLPAALVKLVQSQKMHLYDISGTLRHSFARSKVDRSAGQLDLIAPRLKPLLDRSIKVRMKELERICFRLEERLIDRKINDSKDAYQQSAKNLSIAANQNVGGLKARLASLERLRETLGYKATLNRGYTVIRSGDAVITTTKQAKMSRVLQIEFSDGRLSVSGQLKNAKKSSIPRLGQGSLF